MPETQFATTLIVCLKAGVALLVSAGTVLRRWDPRSLQVDNIVYPPRISAETIRLPAELLQEEARAASRPRNHTRTITSPPPFRSIPRAWFGSRLQPFSQLSISDQTSSVSGKQIDEGGNRSTPSPSARSGADCEE